MIKNTASVNLVRQLVNPNALSMTLNHGLRMINSSTHITNRLSLTSLQQQQQQRQSYGSSTFKYNNNSSSNTSIPSNNNSNNINYKHNTNISPKLLNNIFTSLTSSIVSNYNNHNQLPSQYLNFNNINTYRYYSSDASKSNNTNNNTVATTSGNERVTIQPAAVDPNAPPPPKEPLKDKVKRVAKHYWLGTKLLFKNIAVTYRLFRRLRQGNTLTRRERQLLKQTMGDVVRLVPFLIIMIVPFLEFALPVLLKLFPNLLPSTYEWKEEQDAHKTNKLKGNNSMQAFLMHTFSEISEELKHTDAVNAQEFHEFMQNVKSGHPVTGQQVLKFSKLFGDEITMEKLQRPQLLMMNKYLSGASFVQQWYSNDYLKEQITKKLKKIKQDDILIKKEGLATLTLEELVDAALVRGLQVEGRTKKQIEEQLEQWLDLSLNQSVPPSLLILARAFTLVPPEKTTSAATLSETVGSIPQIDQIALSKSIEHIPQAVLVDIERSLDDIVKKEAKLEELSKEVEVLDTEEKVEESKETTTPADSTSNTTTTTTTTTTSDNIQTTEATTDSTTNPPEHHKKLTTKEKEEQSLNDDDDVEIQKQTNNNNNNNNNSTTNNTTKVEEKK